MALSGLTHYDEVVIKYESSNSLFFIDNEEGLKEKAREYNCGFYNTLEAQKYLKKKYDNANSIFFIAYIVLFIVGFIFIYSTMRSKMITDIYKIGVYRSLGSRKISIYKKYIIDIIALSLLTSGVGYLITSLIYFVLYSNLNVYLDSIQLLFNIEYFVIGFALMIIFMLIFGMLPIWNLLKKTPKEICAKYDI
jgi:ABC-type antimicrobial peptide transport system permease subunit